MVKSEEQVAKEVGWWFERLLTKLESEMLRERLRDEKLAAARRFAEEHTQRQDWSARQLSQRQANADATIAKKVGCCLERLLTTVEKSVEKERLVDEKAKAQTKATATATATATAKAAAAMVRAVHVAARETRQAEIAAAEEVRVAAAQKWRQETEGSSATIRERRAPAALNATGEQMLREHVLDAARRPATDEILGRPPLLAPFITCGLLCRVRNILRGLNDEERAGWGQSASLAKVVAALTGAPPLTYKKAGLAGGYLNTRCKRFDDQIRKTLKTLGLRGKDRLAWQEERRKELNEVLYVCPHGSTPDLPCEAVLCADLALRSALPLPRSAPLLPGPAPPTTSSELQLALAPAVLALSECTEKADADEAVQHEAAAAQPVAADDVGRLGSGLSEPEAIRIAEAEGLQLIRSATSWTGFEGVTWRDRATPYQVHWVESAGNCCRKAGRPRVKDHHVTGRKHKGRIVSRSFKSAAEAALAYARAVGPAGVAAAAAAATTAAAATAAAAQAAAAKQAAAALTARAERTLERSLPRPSVLPRRFDGTCADLTAPVQVGKRYAEKSVQELQAKRQAQWAQPVPTRVDQQGRSWWVVEQLLASRQACGSSGRERSREFLVRWQDFGAEHDSWEPESNIADAAKVRAFDAPGKGAVRPRALPPSCAAEAAPPMPMGAWRARANAASHAQRIGCNHQATFSEVGCGDDAADGACLVPSAALAREAAQGVAALLTASAFAPVGAFCFVAPCDCGLGLFARGPLQPGQFIAE